MDIGKIKCSLCETLEEVRERLKMQLIADDEAVKIIDRVFDEVLCEESEDEI